MTGYNMETKDWLSKIGKIFFFCMTLCKLSKNTIFLISSYQISLKYMSTDNKILVKKEEKSMPHEKRHMIKEALL